MIPHSITFFKLNSLKNAVFVFIIKKSVLFLFGSGGGGGPAEVRKKSLSYDKYIRKKSFSFATLEMYALDPDTHKSIIKNSLYEKIGPLDFFF